MTSRSSPSILRCRRDEESLPFFESTARSTSERRTPMNIVLVHGAWADGSCWSAVIERLQADGYTVTAPQFPMTQLSADVARLRQLLARQNDPHIVLRHSYRWQNITAQGTDAPNDTAPAALAGVRSHHGH